MVRGGAGDLGVNMEGESGQGGLAVGVKGEGKQGARCRCRG